MIITLTKRKQQVDIPSRPDQGAGAPENPFEHAPSLTEPLHVPTEIEVEWTVETFDERRIKFERGLVVVPRTG